MFFKRNIKKLLALILVSLILFTCLLVYIYKANREEGYALSGDGYIVIVTKKQFNEFGTGEFSDYDLEKFIDRYNLKKTYPDNSQSD